MGAMENWGLITYRTTAVLFDEAKSDTRYKNRIAYVVAHGLSTLIMHGEVLTNVRIGSSMVWQPRNHGLVERTLA